MIYMHICFFIVLSYILLKGLYYLLTIYQQEHYDHKKFIKTLPTFYGYKKYNYLLYLLVIISLIDNLYLYILALLLGIIACFINDKFIIRFRFTKRMIRLLITYFVVLCLIILCLPPVFHLEGLGLLALLNPFYLLICNYLNYPFEYLIKKFYKHKAQKRLEQQSSLFKIAITGSYGKTTTKNIISSVVSKNYITLSTPKSYNTMMGLSSTINNSLRKDTEILVVEMGAYRQGEIREMADFINPQIAIITDVGYQHMDTFKTIENVCQAKCEILEDLSYESVAIINGDNENLKNKTFINIKDTYLVGFNDYNYIQAQNIITQDDTTTFDIKYGDKVVENVQTSLLGKHNIFNILIAFGVKLALETYGFIISNDSFLETIKNLKPVPHRLNYLKVNNFHIYDDSYNANEVGIINAIEVLKNQPYHKVIITPGVVDCGKETKRINETIANEIKMVFNDIYLINNYSSRIIKDKLEQDGIRAVIKDSFQEAYQECLEKYRNRETALLIANDLPDNYLMRRKN